VIPYYAVKAIALDRRRELIRAADEWRLVRAGGTSGTKVRVPRRRSATRFALLRRSETA
jgi:hypothetical protein